jgi:hypothetical protein
VAEKIREIAEGESWQLRHLVGPDAASLLQNRAAMTDEEWVDVQANRDENEWAARFEKRFGYKPFEKA